jgi:hypothetical protein
VATINKYVGQRVDRIEFLVSPASPHETAVPPKIKR